MAERANYEAGELATRILGAAALPAKHEPGFTTAIDRRGRSRSELHPPDDMPLARYGPDLVAPRDLGKGRSDQD